MPYEYLDDIATADAAFVARGDSLEELFVSAADATMNVMVADLDTISPAECRTIQVENDAVDLLLFDLLQEIIFYKDAESLLLRITEINVSDCDGILRVSARAFGEEINPRKHDLIVDVKAVTFHHFRVEQAPGGWEATVILDI